MEILVLANNLIKTAIFLLAETPKIDLRDPILKEWDSLVKSYELLKEPSREAIKFSELGLTPDGGYDNILKVYNKATPEEKVYWGKWYLNASSVVKKIAEKHNLPVRVVSGVVAVLSPGSKWWLNVRVAEKLIMFFLKDRLSIMGKLSAYPVNIQKALNILETESTREIQSPKVSVFFKSLMHPKKFKDHLVLDGHAINIARGAKRALKGMQLPNTQDRIQMVEDYKKAAETLGVSVQAVQAVTWYIWKSVMQTEGVPVEELETD